MNTYVEWDFLDTAQDAVLENSLSRDEVQYLRKNRSRYAKALVEGMLMVVYEIRPGTSVMARHVKGLDGTDLFEDANSVKTVTAFLQQESNTFDATVYGFETRPALASSEA